MVSYSPTPSDSADHLSNDGAARSEIDGNHHQLLHPFSNIPDRNVADPLPILRLWGGGISILLEDLRKSDNPRELASSRIAGLLTTLFHGEEDLSVTRAYNLLIPRDRDARAADSELLNIAHISGWSSAAADFTTPCSLEDALSIGAALLSDLRAAVNPAISGNEQLVSFVHRWSARHGESRNTEDLTREHILIEEGLLRIVSLFAPHTGDTRVLQSALVSAPDERIFAAALDGIGRFGRQTENSTAQHIVSARHVLAEALVTAADAKEPANRRIDRAQSFDFSRLWFTLSFLSPEALPHIEKFLADVKKDEFRYPSWAICAVLKCAEKLTPLLMSDAEQRYSSSPTPAATGITPSLATRTITLIEDLLSYRRDSVRAFALGFLYHLSPQTLDNRDSRISRKLDSLATQGDDIEQTERLVHLVITTEAELRIENSLPAAAAIDANEIAGRVKARWKHAPEALRTFAQYARTLPDFLAPLWPLWVKPQ
jgi:hypothetical protein